MATPSANTEHTHRQTDSHYAYIFSRCSRRASHTISHELTAWRAQTHTAQSSGDRFIREHTHSKRTLSNYIFFRWVICISDKIGRFVPCAIVCSRSLYWVHLCLPSFKCYLPNLFCIVRRIFGVAPCTKFDNLSFHRFSLSLSLQCAMVRCDAVIAARPTKTLLRSQYISFVTYTICAARAQVQICSKNNSSRK